MIISYTQTALHNYDFFISVSTMRPSTILKIFHISFLVPIDTGSIASPPFLPLIGQFYCLPHTEDGSNTLLRNVGKHRQDHTVSHSRRPPSILPYFLHEHTYIPRLRPSTLNIVAAGSFEMLKTTYMITHCRKSEDLNLKFHRSENLKSYTFYISLVFFVLFSEPCFRKQSLSIIYYRDHIR
jgi:hypothetical protein